MADGELIFDTKVDTDNFEKGIKDIRAKLKNISTSVGSLSTTTKKAFDGMSSAQIGLVNSLEQTKKKMTELKSKIEEIESAKVPTEKYTKLQEKVQNLKNEYKSLIEEQKKQKSFTGYNANSAEAKALDEQIKEIRKQLNISSIQLSNLKKSGSGFEAQGTTAESAGLREKLNVEESKFIKLNKQLEELNQKEENATKSASKLKNALNNIGGATKKFGNKMASAFKKSTDPAQKFIKKLTSIGTMLKARVIRALVSGIVNGVKNGFNNLVQYSSKLNTSISSIKSSFTQLNNALVTAFMPILQKIAPIIQNIINKMIEAINVVAQFTARLFNNSTTFTKAKKINEDYAKSLSNTSKEQKKAFSFDTIEKIDSKTDDGSVSASEMFEEANIESGVLNYTDGIKEAIQSSDWRSVGSLLANKVNGIFNSISFEQIGTNIGVKINNILNGIYGFLTNVDWQGIGTSFAMFLNNAFLIIDFNLLGRTIAQKIKLAVELAFGFVSTFDWGELGIKLSDMVNGWFAEIDWAMTAETISIAIIGLIDTISNFIINTDWESIGNAISTFLANIDWSGIIAGLAELIGVALGSLPLLLFGCLDDTVKAIGDYFSEKIYEAGGDVVQGLFNGIIDGLANLWQWVVDNIAKPLVDGVKKALGIHSPSTVFAELGGFLTEGLLSGLSEKWENLKSKVGEMCSGLVDKVKNIFGIHSPSTVFADIGENITAGVEEGIGDGNGAFDGLNSLSADSVENMKTAWTGIAEWFSTNVTNPLNSVFEFFANNLNDIFDNILSNVKNTVVMSINMMNIMIESLESAMDNVVKAVNRIVSSINATSGETGISLPYAQSEKFKRIPIPKLATGTVVPANYGEFAAILGDNKRETEVVSPLSTMKQALIEALAESGFNNGGDATIILELDGNELGRAVYRLNKKESKRIGTSMRITGGAY